MKVVLIAESEDTINEYSAFLEEAGADVITYRWFLKALDNLTEIQPHIIIVSALDFPRHWKTIFTHIEAGAFKNQPLVYLITDPSFTASEKKKAMYLGAQDIFLSPLTSRDKNSLLSMLPAGMGIEMPSRPNQPMVQEAEPAPEAESPFVEDGPVLQMPVSDEDNVSGEYAALKAQAEEGFIDDTIIPPSVSMNDFPAADDIPTNDDLVVGSADEDILTKIEDEMTVREIPDELKDEPATIPEPEQEAFPEPENVTASVPEQAERPVQVEWSAPIDEEPAVSVSEQYSEPSSEPEEGSEVQEEFAEGYTTFSFVNPTTGMVVTGEVQKYDHPTIKFVPESREAISGIRFGQILDQCKFSFEGETVKARAQVRGLGNVIEFCLLY